MDFFKGGIVFGFLDFSTSFDGLIYLSALKEIFVYGYRTAFLRLNISKVMGTVLSVE